MEAYKLLNLMCISGGGVGILMTIVAQDVLHKRIVTMRAITTTSTSSAGLV